MSVINALAADALRNEMRDLWNHRIKREFSLYCGSLQGGYREWLVSQYGFTNFGTPDHAYAMASLQISTLLRTAKQEALESGESLEDLIEFLADVAKSEHDSWLETCYTPDQKAAIKKRHAEQEAQRTA